MNGWINIKDASPPKRVSILFAFIVSNQGNCINYEVSRFYGALPDIVLQDKKGWDGDRHILAWKEIEPYTEFNNDQNI